MSDNSKTSIVFAFRDNTREHDVSTKRGSECERVSWYFEIISMVEKEKKNSDSHRHAHVRRFRSTKNQYFNTGAVGMI